MRDIPNKSIDAIITDPPYGVTKNKKDIIIPFDKMWEQCNRIIKDNGAIILFGQDKFTAHLMLSNEKYHRYNLIWKKVLPSGFLNAKRMPLREHEDICVFYKKMPTYNPQMRKGKPNHSKGRAVGQMNNDIMSNNNYGNFKCVETVSDMKYPTSILEFPKPHPSVTIHPTQKSIELIEWLIKSYSNPGDTILDFAAGSMTLAIAAINTERNYICIEKDPEIFEVGKKRVEDHYERFSERKSE